MASLLKKPGGRSGVVASPGVLAMVRRAARHFPASASAIGAPHLAAVQHRPCRRHWESDPSHLTEAFICACGTRCLEPSIRV